MRKTILFAVAATLIVIGFGLWAASPAKAPVSPAIVQGIEPAANDGERKGTADR